MNSFLLLVQVGTSLAVPLVVAVGVSSASAHAAPLGITVVPVAQESSGAQVRPGSHRAEPAPAARRFASDVPSVPSAPYTCGGSTPVYLEPGERMPGAPVTRGGANAPLKIFPHWDASVMASLDEPYAIAAGADRIKLTINGVSIPAITLTQGPARTADEVAAELNANATFASVADARGWNGHNGGGSTPEALLIRSKGATFGSIDIESTASNATGVLGFAIGFNGPSVTAAQRFVFLYAFAEWELIVQQGGNITSPYVMRVAYRPSQPGSALATAAPVYSGSVIVGGIMNFDSTEPWFEDPTPSTSTEFNGCVPDGCVTCASSCIDLLTIVRHEAGHALGWSGDDGLLDLTTTLTASLSSTATTAQVASTAGFLAAGSFTVGGEQISYGSKTSTQFLGLTRGMGAAAHANGASVRSDNVYDSTRLNIGVVGTGSHTSPVEHPLDIMNPTFGNADRRPISLYPAAARLSRFQGATIPMGFVDPVGSPSPDGRAIAPFPDLTSAIGALPSGIPLLLANGTYFEPGLPFEILDARVVTSARGGAPVVR